MSEPEMMDVEGVNIVKPTARFEVGRYIKLGPTIGVVFPGLVFGPKGAEIRKAYRDFLEKFVSYQTQAARSEAQAQTTDLLELFNAIEEALIPLLKASLKINYTPEIVDWIIENIPFQMSTVAEIMQIMQGDSPDDTKGASFR